MSAAAIDPDDPRPPYIQVANVLRAAILTKRLGPGDKLPSQAELASRYGVARMTVQQSLRILRDENLIVSRQGSGVFVRERAGRPVGLRPHIEAAFEQPNVTIDFSGYTAETLHTAIQEPLDKIRDGRLTPDRITVRLLLADMSKPIALPIRGGDDPGDDPRIRVRMQRTAERYAGGIHESLRELQQLGLVDHAETQIRVHSVAPLFKLYAINGAEVFFGFYPVVEHTVVIDRESVPTIDPMGKDTSLFHYTSTSDTETLGSQYVSEAMRWFDSIWTTLAQPADL